jgi:hypothetical protein
MKSYQNKLIKFNAKSILFTLVIIVITTNYNNSIANDSLAHEIYNIIFGVFGIDIDKIDRSYNNVTISNGIINNLVKNIYNKNNMVNLAEEQQDHSITGNFYRYTTNAECNKSTKDYSKITHNIGCINIDTNFKSMIDFGAGYGFANTKASIYERKTTKYIGSDNIATHIAMLFGYSSFSIINTNITLMGATSKHSINSSIVKDNSYNSHFFSANLNTELEINLLLFSLHLLSNLGLSRVYSSKTNIQNITIPKVGNNLFNFGLSFTTNSKLDIKLMELAYRISLGYQLANINGRIVKANNFFISPDNPPLQSFEIMHPAPLMHNLIAEVNLSLQIYDYVQIAGDLSYIYGNKTNEFGFGAKVSYLF